jgi:hypothetical protein
MARLYCLAFFILLHLTSLAQKTGVFLPTDTIDLVLKSIRVEDYIGKPVDSLLRRLPAGAVRSGFITAVPSLNAPKYRFRKYLIRYSNSDMVEIEVYEFRFMNPVSPTKTWDFEAFKTKILQRRLAKALQLQLPATV